MKRPYSDHPAAVKSRAHSKRYPDHQLCRERTKALVRKGILKRHELCEVGLDCAGRIEAHHDDYARPDVVRWLCRKHHRQADAGKSGRKQRTACRKCESPWSYTSTGRKYCQSCNKRRRIGAKCNQTQPTLRTDAAAL